MQVFKTFLKVMKKRLHISMIYIVIFIAITVVMARNADPTGGFEDKQLDISVTDLDNTAASRALTDYIAQNHNLVEVGSSKDEMLDALYYQTADIILTIDAGFADRLEQGETDDLLHDYRVPGTYTAALFDMQINRYISTVSACLAGGMCLDNASAYTAQLLAESVDAEMYSDTKETASAPGSDAGMFFQYLVYILISVLLLGLCPSLLVMTGKAIRSRTNCSCMSAARQTAQLVLGTFLFSGAVYLLLMIVGAVMYPDFFFSKAGALCVLNGLVFLLFATLFTLFLAVLAPSERVVSIIANVFGLGMSFLCGVFVPQRLLSDTVLGISRFLPAYWYIRANNMVSGLWGEVFDRQAYLVCIGIQLAFSGAVFALTLVTARRRQTSGTVS